MQQSIDEGDLIKLVAIGRRDAIVQFYNGYVDRLYASVFNQVGRDHDAAQEIVQDTFFAAIRSAANFQGKSSLYTWLYSIARRKVADFYRNKYRVRQIQYETNAEVDSAIDCGRAGRYPAAEGEDEQVVSKAVDSLPLHYKEVLLLKYVDEMSMKEIGIALNRSCKSVEGLLSRARSMLKEALLKSEVRDNHTLTRLNKQKNP